MNMSQADYLRKNLHLDLKDLRGRKQSALFTNYLEMVNSIIHDSSYPTSAKLIFILQSPFKFKAYRQEEAEEIAWVNALPERVIKGLNDNEMSCAYSLRYFPCSQKFDDEFSSFVKLGKWNHWVAVRTERRQRRDEIQRRWDIRKSAHALNRATPEAAAPARAVRL
ncbi:hypothetical protein [Novilysobacter arseniciresistens]|uniref:hypothetical protein n=1 Tax=Novilysobacter arseniciresistens TaxID=1385522 RepID=UPI0013629847|nr:hypothetical protein [Lysobacter arseniciresistens]